MVSAVPTPTPSSSPSLAPKVSQSVTISVKRSTYSSGQIETLDLENQYLPVVVACENGNAPYESMKAQAVAARTFAMYKKNHPRSADFDIYDDQRDQVYNPSHTVTNQHRQSVTDTNEVVLEYTGDYHTIICAFYVSGTGSTVQYVTYNEGKSGNDITQTSLGYTTNPPSKFPDNRGCMGQVQANNLASSTGYNYPQILRYFYGNDIEGLGGSNGGSIYDRQAAYNYAQKYWDEVCSDGYFWNTRTGYISLSLGTNIVGWTGYDCAHFVSCCIGSESHEQGGGLDVPSRTATYGEPSAQNLGDWLIDEGIAEQKTSINQLEKGDVINYDWTGDGHWDHAALYLGSGKVAAHTTCVCDEPWQLDTTHHRLIHIKTAESIITPLSGDLNGDGTDSYGTFDSSTAGFTFNGKTVHFGTSTDLPVMGDWDNDGSDEIGIYRPDNGGGQSEFHLVWQDWGFFPDGASVDASYRKVIPFGYYPNNIPIAGDWDGINNDDIGGFCNNKFYLYTLNWGSGEATPYAGDPTLGVPGDKPIIGDWDGDEDDDIGVFRSGADTNYFYLDLGLTGDVHECGPYSFGNVGDEPLIGDWDGDGDDDIGAYRPGDKTFHPNYPPTLSNGYVTPSSGDTSTTFDYYVTYTDSEDDEPTTKYVYVDGSPQTMTKISGSYTSGATFKYSTTLSAGSHNYYFYFDDGCGHTERLPTSGTRSGPTVGIPSQGQDIAAFKDGMWALKYGPVNQIPDFQGADKWVFFGGGAGWTPVVGDFNDDGSGDVALYHDGQWALKYGPVNLIPDFQAADKWVFFGGGSGWTPLVGDFNGDNTDDVGLYSNGQGALKYGPVKDIGAWPAADKWVFFGGGAGWTPVVGDVNYDNTDDLVLSAGGQWALKYEPVKDIHAWQAADKWVFFATGGWTPLVGDFGSGLA